MRKKLSPAERDAIESFPCIARKLCTLIALPDEQELNDFLSKVASLLGELYSVAFLVPEVSPATNKNRFSEKMVAHRTKRYKFLNQQLSIRLGAANRYWQVFDPPDKESLVSTTLSDDLADICLDLEDGLALQRDGVPRDDVVWQWRFDFRNHWGRHAVSALTAIHHLVAWDDE